ncbi:MAG: peptidase S41, partial [Bacteroidales bacterium]|nr:peptidase S41 [Bacteroidales bacterium]
MSYSKNDSESFFAAKEGRLKQSRIIVILNEYSASASEILAASIQDHDRGVIIGRRSFGKG